jgi:hypothetical protein|eukprot:COSAG06_NODE_189_length_20763_cov_8.677376_3_plen_45_part_00
MAEVLHKKGWEHIRALRSNGWYLDGGLIYDWQTPYMIEPLSSKV